MLFLKNIQTVSKYESKLLYRSWFFKVFATLTVVATIFTAIGTLNESRHVESIPTLLAYSLMLTFNIGQAVVSIFLASEYLKRDKQLDTSEVFYVRPLSNAEYMLGKMWGTIRVFLLLNFIVIAVGIVCGYTKLGAGVDIGSFFKYFLLINLPTLVYIIGLSTILMLIIKNQALTFVILLGYIGLTIYYIGDKYYYLFDYMCYNVPLMESTITGFADLPALIIHRMMYLLLGFSFILFSILMFRRLPNSHYALVPWGSFASVVFMLTMFLGYMHVSNYTDKDSYRNSLIALNNENVYNPKIVTDSCNIDVVQQGDKLFFETRIVGRPTKNSTQFTFTLNPGFTVTEALCNGVSLPVQRDRHLLKVTFPEEKTTEDSVSFVLKYGGVIDERICYLDIPEELLVESGGMNKYKMGKRYAFQDADFTMLTPESYWYPRPGVCYSSESPDWQQNYFTHFSMRVTPNVGLTPVSQGKIELSEDSLSTQFALEYPLQSLSLLIGHYNQVSVKSDNTLYSAWYLDGHDYFIHEFDSIQDTLPKLIKEMRRDIEREFELPYPFKRFSFVETPVHFASFSRTWTRSQERQQPEMLFLPERGFGLWQFDFNWHIKWRRDQRENHKNRGGRILTDTQIEAEVFNLLQSLLRDQNGQVKFDEGRMGRRSVTIEESPYYIFPQMYNFKYNIYSSQWSVANRLIEIRLSKSPFWNNFLQRNVNGLSNEEKCVLLLQERSFKELLKDVELRNLMNNIIEVQGKKLFLGPEKAMGVTTFRDSLFNYVKAHAFENISFEALLDTIGKQTDCDLQESVKEWEKPIKVAEFLFGTPTVTKVTTEKKDIFQGDIVISNISDNPGSVDMKLIFWTRNGDKQIFDGEKKPNEWIVNFGPKETKRIVTHWEEAPNVFSCKALFSKNLPMLVTTHSGKVETVKSLTPEGEYPLSADFLEEKDEIIVDNENDTLFELSVPPPSGLLNEWIKKKSIDEDFKYSGIQEWNPPMRWTLTTDGGFYGKSIRSAAVIRSGDGEECAKWKLPIPEHGRYELYFHIRKPGELNWGGWHNRGRKMYNLIVENGEHIEELEINMRRVDNGWALLGTFDVACDTMLVTLTNKTRLRYITADAVKLVKRKE
ncbi:MAG: xanthan lyase [Bacteroidaceae bacterium]|nr:xanthan lyase [Bacteroidaceae bacterium]